MGIKEAGESLYQQLTSPDRPDWFQTVGVADNGKGGGELFVYTMKKKHGEVPTEWEGFPVKVQYVGSIQPAGAMPFVPRDTHEC